MRQVHIFLVVSTSSAAARRWHFVLHRWPVALGLAAAAGSLATGGNADSAAITVAIAAWCYLAAAALGRPWVVWVAVAGGTLVVIGTELVGLPWWAGLGSTAVILVGVGLVLRVPRLALTAETAALAGFGGVAVLSLFLAPQVGLVVAGLALASHAIWDAVHLRRKAVVSPSLAEACIFLDVPLGIGLILLAFLG